MIRNTPFLRILFPVALGIWLAWGLDVPQWVLWTALAVCYACAWFTVRRGAAGWVYTFASLMLTAMALTGTHASREEIPPNEKVLLQLHLTDNPAESGRWRNTYAYAAYWRDTVWHRSSERIALSVDTSYRVAMGEQLVCAAYVNRFGDSGYARLMHARGYSGHAYVTQGNMIAKMPQTAATPRTLSKGMQAAAAARLARLDLPQDEGGMVSAMATGERRTMSAALKAAYNRVGATHLLAVSGLHVAIVFVLINGILYLLPMLRRGHIAKNIIAVAAIWAYAAMTGLSPSVLRSAIMFTGVQAALAATLHRGGLNILLATAAVMLLIWPGNLFDVSFQLSFMAVLSIAAAYGPLYERTKTRHKAINVFAGVFLMGLVATVGTAPLVAYHFGNFPLIGLFINPPLIFLSHVILLVSTLWIIAPVGFMGGAAGWILGVAAETQNRIVEWSASLPASAIALRLTAFQVFLIYFLYLAVAVAFYLIKPGKQQPEFA